MDASVSDDAGGADAGGGASCACVHGTCNARGLCTCEAGFAGATCNACAPGHYGASCAACPACEHGSCDEGSAGSGACQCEAGWAGATCVSLDFVGSGADGALRVQGAANLSLDNHAGRTCADGGDAVAYNVVSFASAKQATLSAAPSAGCLAQGDEVLLISLQGASGAVINVGRYELLRVASVDGTDLTFASAKQNAYGDAKDVDTGLGTTSSTQRVIVQRVPQYTDVEVPLAAALTAKGFDGTTGGVLAFRASGTVSIAGSVTMLGAGFRGGVGMNVSKANGFAGESYVGPGAQSTSANAGGGGGGHGDSDASCSAGQGSGGGGGGHGTPGASGAATCAGSGGSLYGSTMGDRSYFGSGGGSGGVDNATNDNPPPGSGGAGGGVIVIWASTLNVTGSIDARGTEGVGDLPQDSNCSTSDTTRCWDFTGPGGGGAGGSIMLHVDTADLGTGLVQASGGAGGDGRDGGSSSGDGGAGGNGRVFVAARTMATGSTIPAATSL